MNVNSTASGLANPYYQASGQANDAQGAITSAAQKLTSGSIEGISDNTGFSTDTVGKLLNILV